MIKPAKYTWRYLVFFTAFGILFHADPAYAHSFGIRYDLPLPLWLYLTGAGGAVALSFAVMALFLKGQGEKVIGYRLDILALPLFKWLGTSFVTYGFQGLAISGFLLILSAGFIGNPDPFQNISPTFVWVVWWVGMAFLASLAGNIWDAANPWNITSIWCSKLTSYRARTRAYPAWLGQWPSVGLLLIFAWMELISEQAEKPRILASVIIVYSFITWCGIYYYGRKTWLKSGEVFTVIFSLFARFAPFHGHAGKLELRFPASGLLTVKSVPLSTVCFVLVLLTTVTFDGLLETPSWASLLNGVSESLFLRPALLFFQSAGLNLIVLIKSIALLVFPLIFIGAYFTTCKAIAMAGGGTYNTLEIAGYFVLSLVPIAIAYHLSHYLSFLLIAGQNIIPLVSDPFGWDWDLFGTAGYAIDIGIVNAKMIWYVSVTAIVIGHVMAVYIAHIMAIRVFIQHRLALLSQVPMLILMIGYTMTSLWVLSQPIIS